MGFWNDGVRPTSRPTSRPSTRARSRSSSSSPARSTTRTHRTTSRSSQSKSQNGSRPSFSHSASSFFGLANNPSISGRGGGGNNNDRGLPGGGGSSAGRSRSYTSARPRTGFVARVRKFLRQIWEYMRKHPVKVFMLVIMPLITGGVLTKLLGAVGVRLPASLQRFVGSGMNRPGGNGNRYYARGGARDASGGTALPGMGGGVGDAVQGALTIAKMFM